MASSHSSQSENVKNLASILESNELALVWSVGDGSGAFGPSVNSRNVKKQITQLNLVDLCDAVKTVYPLALNTKNIMERKNNHIKLSHVSVLFKGLAISLNTQLNKCKRDVTGSFAMLSKPAQIELAIPTTPEAPEPQEAIPSGVGSFTQEMINMHPEMGNLNISLEPTDEAELARYERTLGLNFGEEEEEQQQQQAGSEIAEERERVRMEVEEPSIQRPDRRRQANRGPAQPRKKIGEREIISMLVRVSGDRRANRIFDTAMQPELPERSISRNDFHDHTVLPDVDVLPSALVNGVGLQHSDGMPQGVSADDYQPPRAESPPRPVVDLPMPTAPRKEKRQLNDMVLEPLPETPTRTRKARRRSLFNVFDEKTQFTTREIKLGMVPMTEEEMKQRRNEHIIRPVKRKLGMAFIETCGRKESSRRLLEMRKEYLSLRNTSLMDETKRDASMNVPDQRSGVTSLDAQPAASFEINAGLRLEDFPVEIPREEEWQQDGSAGLSPEKGVPIERKMTFNEIIQEAVPEGEAPNRLLAAKTFSTLLKMQAKHKIQIHQQEPYGVITVEPIDAQNV